MGTTHRSWWYAEVIRWTLRDHTMQVHREWTCFKNVLQMTAISVYNLTKQREKKREWLCLGPCHKQENFNNYAEQTTLNNKGGKVFVTGPYNAKKALMITGAFFAEKETVELPSCDSKLLGEGDSIMVVWCSPKDHTMRTQDERLLSYTIKTDETSNHVNQDFGTNIMQVSWWYVCTRRHTHCANIAMIVAGTSAQTRKLHVNQTRVQTILPISWWNDVHHGTRQHNRNDDNHWNLLANRKSHNVNEDAWTSARLKD